MKRNVLVTGGSGHYGRQIVRALLEMQQAVRVLTRDGDSTRGILGSKAEIIEGDLRQRESRVKALAGMDSLVISVSAFSPSLIRQLKEIERDAVLKLLDDAKAAGVKRVVYLSVYDIREDVLAKVNAQFASLARFKQEIENYLKESPFNWTVLGAPPAMEMFFAMLRGSKMFVPGGGPPAIPTIASADVGRVAASAALRDDLGEHRFRLAGPQALSFPQAAEIIGNVLGREIKVKKIPLFPVKLAGILAWPFTHYLRYLAGSVVLLNNFPVDLAEAVPGDHRRLREIFGTGFKSLEEIAQEWK